MNLKVPPELAASVRHYGGARGEAWLAALPALARTMARNWALDLVDVVGFGATSIVLDAGPDRVLKLAFRDRENAFEAEALHQYAGEGAIRLFEADPRGALLLERADPARTLLDVEESEADRIAARLMRRLWRPVPARAPFERLDSIAAAWTAELPNMRAMPEDVRAEAAAAARRLLRDPVEPRLLHQDLHHQNVLAASREPWLVIDPKPVAGDPAYDVAALLRGRMKGTSGPVAERFERLVEETGRPRGRVRDWALLKEVAWGASSSDPEGHARRARAIATLR